MRRQPLTAILTAIVCAALAAACVAGVAGRPGWALAPHAPGPFTLPTTPCGGYFIAAASLNGASGYRLLLDSGVRTTLIAPETARALGARRHLDSMAVGDVRARGRIPIRVRPMRALSHALGTPIDGIAGFSLFDSLAVTFDFPKQAVRVEAEPPSAGAPGVLPLVRVDRPHVRARIGGRNVDLLVDTGFSGALALGGLTRHPLAAPPVTVGASMRIGGLRLSKAAPLAADVETPAFVLERPVARDAAGASLLGLGILKDLVVTFAPGRGLIRVVRPDGQPPGLVPTAPLRGTGLVLSPAEAHFDVLDVLAGSAAARAGVRAGDRIVAIDGVGVAAMGCGRRGFDDGKPRTLRLARDGRERDVRVGPAVLVRPSAAASGSPRRPALSAVCRPGRPGRPPPPSAGFRRRGQRSRGIPDWSLCCSSSPG